MSIPSHSLRPSVCSHTRFPKGRAQTDSTLFNLKWIGYFFSLLIFFSSCHNKDKYLTEVKYLDSLQIILEKVAVEFRKSDTVLVAANRDSIIEHLTFIQDNYRSKDTMPRETAIFLQQYRSIKQPLDVYLKESREINEELEYSEKQTVNLIHDLRNALLEEGKAKQFFNDERLAMEQLIAKVNSLNTLVNENLKKYDEMVPGVREEVKKISERIANSQ